MNAAERRRQPFEVKTCEGCGGKGWVDYPERKHGPCKGTGRQQHA